MKIDSSTTYSNAAIRGTDFSKSAASLATFFSESLAAAKVAASEQKDIDSTVGVNLDKVAKTATGQNKSISTFDLIESKLNQIKKKDAAHRTPEESAYIIENDKRFAEIVSCGKSPEELTSSELDYTQKAGGFVNTMAYLSQSEKALYDKAVAIGDTQAVIGLNQIALIRTGGSLAGGSEGTTYNPLNTEITIANIEKYFRHSIVDADGSVADRFQALVNFLNKESSV